MLEILNVLEIGLRLQHVRMRNALAAAFYVENCQKWIDLILSDCQIIKTVLLSENMISTPT